MTQTEYDLPQHRISIVIPMYNEEDNVAPMIENIQNALGDYPMPWEVLLIDDGSTDHSLQRMEFMRSEFGDFIHVIALQRNFGQTAALQAGIDSARGDVIITMDGDLQNDPEDIPGMVLRLFQENLDLVAGWRKNRKDNLWLRKVPSNLANKLIAHITGVRLHDYGCTLKVFRAKIIKDIRLYGEMHRFIPAWTASITDPSRIKEEVVSHHSRQFGVSKYGISRTFRVILDLLSVYFFMKYKSRPGHFFGKVGLTFGILGSALLGYLYVIKVFFGESIGNRPMLMAAILLILMSVQFLTTGVLSELISRTYYESSQSKPYTIRDPMLPDHSPETGWNTPE